MGVGHRIREVREGRGLTQAQVAETLSADRKAGAPATKASTISQYESGARDPSLPMLEKIAAALGVSPSVFWDPGPRGLPAATTDRQGDAYTSYAVESFVDSSGDVTGALASDAHPGQAAKRGPVRLRDRAGRQLVAQSEHVSIATLPPSAELVKAIGRLELRDTDEVIAPGYLLVVDRNAPPEADKLVVVKKDMVDRSVPSDAPEDCRRIGAVRVCRYEPTKRGWSLVAIDGSSVTFGSGDGWSIIATVLWWRSAP